MEKPRLQPKLDTAKSTLVFFKPNQMHGWFNIGVVLIIMGLAGVILDQNKKRR